MPTLLSEANLLHKGCILPHCQFIPVLSVNLPSHPQSLDRQYHPWFGHNQPLSWCLKINFHCKASTRTCRRSTCHRSMSKASDQPEVPPWQQGISAGFAVHGRRGLPPPLLKFLNQSDVVMILGQAKEGSTCYRLRNPKAMCPPHKEHKSQSNITNNTSDNTRNTAN